MHRPTLTRESVRISLEGLVLTNYDRYLDGYISFLAVLLTDLWLCTVLSLASLTLLFRQNSSDTEQRRESSLYNIVAPSLRWSIHNVVVVNINQNSTCRLHPPATNSFSSTLFRKWDQHKRQRVIKPVWFEKRMCLHGAFPNVVTSKLYWAIQSLWGEKNRDKFKTNSIALGANFKDILFTVLLSSSFLARSILVHVTYINVIWRVLISNGRLPCIPWQASEFRLMHQRIGTISLKVL